MTTLQLTPAQQAILAHAIHHAHGKVDWFPDNIKGAARSKVLEGLANRWLILAVEDEWWVTDDGYQAMGCTPPALPPKTAEAPTEPEEATTTAETENAAPSAPTVRKMREKTKQATLVDMLKSENGATLQEMIDATGWRAHSIRGFLAGTLKQKLGLTVVSDKIGKADRVYRVA